MIEQWPPSDAVPLVAFHVLGKPKGAGSKNAIPLGRRNPVTGKFEPFTHPDGRPKISVKDSSGADGVNWRVDVRDAFSKAINAAHQLVDGPVAVRVTFYGRRPKGHFGTGRNEGVLKLSAPALPHASDLPDGTKLARALEDALNELAWTDDRRVCDMWWSRRFGDQGGADVEIFTRPTTVAETQPEVEALSLLDSGGASRYHDSHGERNGHTTLAG